MRRAVSPKLRLAPLWPAATALVVLAGLALWLLPGTLARDAAQDLIAVKMNDPAYFAIAAQIFFLPDQAARLIIAPKIDFAVEFTV